jgi:sugar/nucleoside kinase (ribokinase family)
VVSNGLFVGLCTLDVVQQVDHLPGANEKITARRQVISAGGPATNAAVTFAALGGRAVLITALGTGPAADLARRDLDDHHVEVVDVTPNERDRLSISAVSVLVGTGERSVVSTDAGRTPVEKPPAIKAWLSTADVVLVDCHHPALAEHAAEAAARLDGALVVDAGRWRPVMADVLPLATTVICSSDFRVAGAKDSIASARELLANGVRDVVVTQGGEPVLWWSGGNSGSVPVPRVDAVDTSGAGDVFHGAYCYYATLPDLDLRQRLEAAARVASIKCEHFGPRSWLRQLPVY